MPGALTLPALAKVNLYLHVTGKREDGYHLLDSLVAFPPAIGDQITITSAPSFSLTLSGPLAKDLTSGDDNLATKAAKSMAQILGKPLNVAIQLEKNIPMGAGLGGGSSDAATIIRGLEKFWDQPLDEMVRHDLMISLGADVPVCYQPTSRRFQGIGEIISASVKLPALYILLIWPGHPTFTKDIFTKRAPSFSTPLPPELPDLKDKDEFLSFLKNTRNDLQNTAEELYPTIKIARLFLETQASCLLARMSGSGSSVFGLFEHESDCNSILKTIEKSHPEWWCAYSPLSA